MPAECLVTEVYHQPFYEKKMIIIMCACHVCVDACAVVHVSKGNFVRWFSPIFTWLLEIKLKISRLAIGTYFLSHLVAPSSPHFFFF